MRIRNCRVPLVGAAALALAACGGGGAGVNSTPFVQGPPPAPPPPAPPPPAPPPPAPPPPATTAEYPTVIFTNPVVGEFLSVGASVVGSYADASGFSGLSTADSDQPHIRYLADGTYEIQMPGASWMKLVIPNGNIPADPDHWNYYAPAGSSCCFTIEQARHAGYLYSELASWSGLGRYGSVAFGVPTPSGQVPVSGSASYSGIVRGSSDVIHSNSFDGVYHVPVAGTVNLNFDFANGSLFGAISLTLDDYTPSPIGTFAFRDTVFSVGSTNYSGKFETNVAGDNFFIGRFTGPNATETIGAWALPFIYNQGGLADNKSHQALGAWIAKRGQ